MKTDEALAKVYAQPAVGEFMTTTRDFPRPGLEAWADRKKSDLMEVAHSSHFIPCFRPFDLLAEPNTALTLLENERHRIGVDSVVGCQDAFHRWIDADLILFQYCGRTTVETEFGPFELTPGEVLLIPGGIAHRSIGAEDSLRYWCLTHEPVDHVMGDDQYTSRTEFTVRRVDGPNWTASPEAARPSTGRVREQMHCWDDGPDDYTTVERDYTSLAGVAKPRGSLGGVKKLRAFDHFTGIVGQPPHPEAGTQPLIVGPSLLLRTYNIRGEQFAFHRALRTEEMRVQFRGDAVDLSEFQNVSVRPGEVTVIPLGIAHSVITDPPDDKTFLRLNFYSSLRWRVATDLTKHHYCSRFEVESRVLEAADWMRS